MDNNLQGREEFGMVGQLNETQYFFYSALVKGLGVGFLSYS